MFLRAQQQNLVTLSLLIFLQGITVFISLPSLMQLVIGNSYNIVIDSATLLQRYHLVKWLIILGPLSMCFSVIFMGALSDRFGRKPILIFCLLLGLVAYTFYLIGIYYHTLIYLIIGRVLVGFSGGAMAVYRAAIADFTTGTQKFRYFSYFMFAYMFAFTVGPLLGSIFADRNLIDWFDVATPIWVCVVLCLCSIFILLEFYVDTACKRTLQFSFIKCVQSLRVFANKILFLYLLCIAFFNFAIALLYFNISLVFVHTLHVTTHYLGIYLVVFGLTACIGLLLAYPLLANKISAFKLFVTGFIGFTICLAFLFSLQIYMYWVLVLPLGLFAAFIWASSLGILSNIFPDTQQGWLMGVIILVSTLAMALAAINCHHMHKVLPNLPVILAFVFCFLGSIMAIYLYKNKSNYEFN